jgi:hypothetical protein
MKKKGTNYNIINERGFIATDPTDIKEKYRNTMSDFISAHFII